MEKLKLSRSGKKGPPAWRGVIIVLPEVSALVVGTEYIPYRANLYVHVTHVDLCIHI